MYRSAMVWSVLVPAMIGAPTTIADDFSAPRGAAEISVIPRPAQVEVQFGSFDLVGVDRIAIPSIDAEVGAIAEELAQWLSAGGRKPTVEVTGAVTPGTKAIALTILHNAALGDEGYEMHVASTGITLAAPRPRGLFYGVQTLRQFAVPPRDAGAGAATGATWQIPCANIVDQPRYPWRGMLLDCGRHFMAKDFV